MAESRAVVGVLLAAGAGSRMGGPKALVGPLCRRGVAGLAGGRLDARGGVRGGRRGHRRPSRRRAGQPPAPPLAQHRRGDRLVARHGNLLARGSGIRHSGQRRRSPCHPRRPARRARRCLRETACHSMDERLPRLGSGPGGLRGPARTPRSDRPQLVGDGRRAGAWRQGARELFATRPHRLVECGDLASGEDADLPPAAATDSPAV